MKRAPQFVEVNGVRIKESDHAAILKHISPETITKWVDCYRKTARRLSRKTRSQRNPPVADDRQIEVQTRVKKRSHESRIVKEATQ